MGQALGSPGRAWAWRTELGVGVGVFLKLQSQVLT